MLCAFNALQNKRHSNFYDLKLFNNLFKLNTVSIIVVHRTIILEYSAFDS